MQQDCARAASRVATVTSASPSRNRTWSRSRVRVRVRVWGSFKCLSVKSGWTKAAAANQTTHSTVRHATNMCERERERARCTALLSLDRRKMRNHWDKVAEICNIQKLLLMLLLLPRNSSNATCSLYLQILDYSYLWWRRRATAAATATKTPPLWA